MNNNKVMQLSRCAVAIGAVLFSGQSFAQQTEENKDVERIAITGSHIKRTDLEGPSPVTIISRDDIDKSGFDNLQQLLERL